jgi:hypothetical protein
LKKAKYRLEGERIKNENKEALWRNADKQCRAGCLGYESASRHYASQKNYGEGIVKIFSKGFIFRTGVRIKDFGERLGHIKIHGVFIFGRLSDYVTRKGLALKESVYGCPISQL